jgi:zinc protease
MNMNTGILSRFALFVFLLTIFGCTTNSNPDIPEPTLQAESALPSDPAIVEGTLDNGMTYRLMKNSQPENRIFLRLVVKAGSVLEDDDQRGIAHLVEHMAFNGSTHFAENELISYFESIGMAFGPDVNAYTSFDETVYMLEIPADDPAMLDTALTVLQDWACGLAFDEAELDKERNVVIEEWRLGRGANGRTQEKMFPFLFGDSRYAVRLPIGNPELVSSVPRERVVDFYKKWYRPDLMSVILVGDADTSFMEEKVKAILGQVPMSDNAKTARPEYDVPLAKDKKALIITDPENSYTQIAVYDLFPAKSLKTEDDYQADIALQIAKAALTARLDEKAQEENAPFLYGGASFYRLNRPLSASTVALIPLPGRFADASYSVLDELDRYEEFGITSTELEEQKSNYAANARLSWQNRDKTESSALISRLVSSALYDTPVLSPDDQYELTTRALEAITLADVNRAIERYFAKRGNWLLVTAQENMQEIPTTGELLDSWINYRSSVALMPYNPKIDDRPLMADEPLSGEITDERLLAENPAITEFTLSNGAKVVVCLTDFKADSFQFSALSRGGLSLLPDDDYPSGLESPDYLEMSGLNGFTASEITKKLAGKNISIYPYITETTAGMSGSSSSTDIETFFQLINLYFTAPYFTNAAWERLLADYQTEIQARKNEPRAVFIDSVTEVLYGDSIRHVKADERFFAMLDRQKAEENYRLFFSDAGNFTFVFTGDFDIEAVKDLSCRYIASLPAAGTLTEAKDNSIPFPAGKPVVRVEKGLEAQSQVLLVFGGQNPALMGDIYTNQELISIMENLMEMRLRETVREKIGGTYGVSVSCTLLHYPSRRFLTQISFGCEPSRAETLAQVVLDEIAALQTSLTSGDDITKLRETFTRGRETAVKTNAFWQNHLLWNISRGDDTAGIADEQAVRSAITATTMRLLIRRYFNLDNYLSAYLLPEAR